MLIFLLLEEFNLNPIKCKRWRRRCYHLSNQKVIETSSYPDSKKLIIACAMNAMHIDSIELNKIVAQHEKILNADATKKNIFSTTLSYGLQVTGKGLIAQIPSVKEYFSDEHYGGDGLAALDSTKQLVYRNKLINVLEESNSADSLESTYTILAQKITLDPLSSTKKLTIAHSILLVHIDTVKLNRLVSEHKDTFNADTARQDVFNAIAEYGLKATDQGLMILMPSAKEYYIGEYCSRNSLTIIDLI